MAEKLTKKKFYNEYRFRIGTLVIVLGAVLSFALGVGATIGLRSYVGRTTIEYKSVEIVGTDGLIGLYGYGQPFKNANEVVYRVTYNNTSHEDRFLQIKATMRSNDFVSQPIASPNAAIDPGVITGSVYSEKKLVKSGTREIFEFPLVEYTTTPTKYVELEAFKSKTD